MYGSLIFLHPAISKFSIAAISFNIACKELKTPPIVLVNKLFQLLNLVCIYGLYRLVWKNVGNDVSKDSPVPNVPHML